MVTMIPQQGKIPLVGIDGITSDNAVRVSAAGADGIIVVSAIISAKSPVRAAVERCHAIPRQATT